jgi:predicted Zn-dependent protease
MRFCGLCVGIATTLLITPFVDARAQDLWQPAQSPCDLKPGHGVVSDGINQLKNAIENPAARRDDRLDQAFEALVRAIRDHDQGSNPAAWYYLGRVFAEQGNAIGADTAFRHATELAPQCQDDVAQYSSALAVDVLANALRGWQEGNPDSATYFFAIASRLDPSAAAIPLYQARMYADLGQLPEASAKLAEGQALAADDPNAKDLLRQATSDIVRSLERQALAEPAMQTVAGNRIGRDTLMANVARDSVLLASLIAEWAGQNLRPEVQQAVARDSTALEQRLSAWRGALPGVTDGLARDSAAIEAAAAPAIEALGTYIASFPDDIDAALRLLTLYSAAGHRDAMDGLLSRILAIEGLRSDQLLQAGLALFNEGHAAQAAAVLEGALEHNPYDRGSLVVLSRAYLAQKDGGRLEATVDRLQAIDPLNPQTMQLTAMAFNLAGTRDSAQHYADLSRGGMGLAISIQQFLPTETNVVVNGSAQNIGNDATTPTSILFEFLNAQGQVVGTHTEQIPTLPPRGQHSISIRADAVGAIAWRYSRQ